MKKYIISLVVLALTLTACDNYFDDKYLDNGDPEISVVKTYEYTLTEADYKTIASNSTNKALAAEQDSVKGLKNRYQNALAKVGENGYFNSYATADMYIPAFIYAKYPHLDSGSIFNITYLLDDGLPKSLQAYNSATRVTVDATDISQVISLLPQPEEGQVIGVIFGDNEVLFESQDGYVWTQCVLADNMYILPKEAKGQVLKWLANKFPYAEAEEVVVVINYDESLKHYTAYEYTFDGENWIENNGVIEETMSFLLDAKKGWVANLSTYYQQALAGEGTMGKIQLFHYDLQDGISYIWAYNNTYGMKGSAYYSGPHYGEGWFVTPKIKLKNAVAPALSFDHALNYGPTDETRYEQITVWVSTDFADDARTATWTQVPWNEWNGETGVPDANSWTFYNSDRMDLSQWNNQTIYIGFRYKTEDGQTCPTWEVKNILVNEPEEEE